ncbi:MAG TPA: hypothetical protein PLL22_01705 [Microbacteriaceae bacterium]|nr:hypothetical protein [Microbacteriaceae bacterium]HQC92543.1 hypothetical protein [Microbacteriaceae bacterium]
MPRQYPGSIPSELGFLIDTLDDYERRLRTLEAPSGEALGNTVAKLAALVSNIQAQLDAYNATRWTNAQIQYQIDSTVAAYVASYMAGNVSIGGELFVNGAVTMPNVFATNIVPLGGTRYAAWVRDGGRLGHT